MPTSPEDEKTTPKVPVGSDAPTTPIGSLKPAEPPSDSGFSVPGIAAPQARYEILAEAGRGGMGIVYKARDRETGELVALKVLKPEIAADVTIIERFKNELKLARKVTHKNVCRIHEFNRATDGTAYISMEYVDGDSLRRVLDRFGGLPLRKGVQIAQQICAGLGEAHAQGVVHRDLKPENIILDQAGNVKIMDFGIARSLEAGTNLTSGIIGTPAYLAPEQAEGKPVDHRSDIYSLGLILYEMFTGSKTFTGQTPVEMALKHVHETPAAPREIEPTIPAYIERAILKCLEKNPAKRFQSAGQLDAAITRQAEEKPIPTEGAEITLPARLAFWQRSDWYLLGAAVLGVILFFPLFYRFHPASAMEITVNAEQAMQIANGALKNLGWVGKAATPSLEFFPDFYYEGASAVGNTSYLNLLRERQLLLGDWDGDYGQGEAPEGYFRVSLKGRLTDIGLFVPFSLLGSQQPEPAQGAAVAQMKEMARSALRTAFGQDAAVGEPSWGPGLPSGSWEWKTKSGPLGLTEYFWARIDFGSRKVTGVSRRIDIPVPMTIVPEAPFELQPRSLLAGPLLALFALILFALRYLHRKRRHTANMWLAGFVALGVALAMTSTRRLSPDPAQMALNIVLPALTFCISFLICYTAIAAVVYYSESRFPVQTAGYLSIFREHLFAKGPGLSLLRGSFAGLAFSGCWMAGVSIGGMHGKALAGMMGWLGTLQVPTGGIWGWMPIWYGTQGTISLVSLARSPLFPFLVLGEALIVGLLMVAFPLSLLRKVSKRSPILLAALAAVWLGFGYSAAGAAVFPTLPYYICAALQAVFLGELFLQYDLLTTLNAVFTLETWLFAFPFWEILQSIDPLPYLVPIGLWVLLVLAGSALYFRPQIAASYRRVATVFE